MLSPTIFAATPWSSNGALIVDCVRLGYLRVVARTLDPTYGKGNWWTEWRPEHLVHHDRKLDGTDFRALPYPNASFEQITYDPPYVCVGGRTSSGIPDMHDAYGLTDAPRSPVALQTLIDDGLTEMRRLVDGRGIVLVKCQDYVSSGKLWLGTHHTLTHALSLGFECVDRLEHISGPRPQPTNRTRADGRPVVQQHARRNLSTLFVLKAPKR